MASPDGAAPAAALSQREVQDLRHAFELFDAPRTGSLRAGELREVLAQVRREGTESDGVATSAVDGVLAALAALPDETRLAFDDFVRLLTKPRPDDGRDELRRIFDLFDAGGKGHIDIQDLQAVATSLGESLSEDELEEMIARACQGTDRRTVTYADFKAVMAKKLFSKDIS